MNIKHWFLPLPLLIPAGVPAQVVQARFAQNLVTATMASHPDLQKMGLHVVPPGGSDDVIIACSVPSKIGKKSSPADLEVERTGKPAVKTNSGGSFYDLAIPLKDLSGHPIGLTVMEIKQAVNAGDQDRLLGLYDPQARIRKSDESVGGGTDQIGEEFRNLVSAKAQLHYHLHHLF